MASPEFGFFGGIRVGGHCDTATARACGDRRVSAVGSLRSVVVVKVI
jgi:hypothetical protein